MVNKHRRDVEENRGARLAFSFDVFTTLHIEQGARGNVIFQFVEFRQRDKSWHCREEEEEEIKETGWISFGLSLLKGKGRKQRRREIANGGGTVDGRESGGETVDNLWIVSLSWSGARAQLVKFAARIRAIRQSGIIILPTGAEPLPATLLTRPWLRRHRES